MLKNEQGVALLIDFENLVYGLEGQHGEEFASHVEADSLFRLAEEYGQVVLANAYADWRFRQVNQFQGDLYRLGVDLIHVFAKQRNGGFKNAVDVKMAVDAVEVMWTLPHISTFVIVSGDRDFIHVLKMLRRYGKVVVGVSPAESVSDDFAALCDRFIRYGALVAANAGQDVAATPSPAAINGLDTIREALCEILAERPDGIKGAQVKPLLRRKLSMTFDESEYGYTRLSDLLLDLPDVVTVTPSADAADITVLPVNGCQTR